MYARTIQCSTGGIITACHAELTGAGRQPVWLQETEGNVELYNKDTGKLICRHALCTRKGRTVYDDSHRKPRNAGVKIAERILVHVSGNREVAMWMDNLKRRKERY